MKPRFPYLLLTIAIVGVAALLLWQGQPPPPRPLTTPVDASNAPNGVPSTSAAVRKEARRTEADTADHAEPLQGRVRCVDSLAAPVPGVVINIVTDSGKSAAEGRTGTDGRFVFTAERGTYRILALHRERKLLVASSSVGPTLPFSLPGPEVELQLTEAHVAIASFVNDTVLNVRVERYPAGFEPIRPGSWSEFSEDELRTMLVDAASGRWTTHDAYRFWFSPPNMPVGGTVNTVRLVALGRRHGECRFEVPLNAASSSTAPLICDFSAFPEVGCCRVRVNVRDAAGSPVDVGLLLLRSTRDPLQAFTGLSNAEVEVPSGNRYLLEVPGFPFTWRTRDPLIVDTSGIDGRHLVEVHFDLPVELRRCQLCFVLDGAPLKDLDSVIVSVHTDLTNDASVRGYGTKGHIFYGASPRLVCMPSDGIEVTVAHQGVQREWRKLLKPDIAEGEIRVDLRSEEGQVSR